MSSFSSLTVGFTTDKRVTFGGVKTKSRGNFKIACERQGWNFSDFEEIRTTSKTSSGAYKFVYVAKEVF